MMSFFLLCTGLLINDANAEEKRKRAKNNTYGLGVGFTLPADSFQLNTMSVRYRHNKKITLEPMIGYSSGQNTTTSSVEEDDGNTVSTQDDDNTPANEVTTETSNSYLEAGLNFRYRVAARDTVDAYALLGFSYGNYESTTEDITEKANAIGVYYGFGLEGWLNDNWSSSIDVFSTGYSSVTTEDEDSKSETTVTSFDPNFRIQVHLYF